jgi:ABC-type multidrug transport system permease subunit
MSSCSEYLADYIATQGGYLLPYSYDSTTECTFCTGSETNMFLKSVSSEYQDRWRNLGIVLVYVVFNAAAAIGLYWLARVPKGKKEQDLDVTKDAGGEDTESAPSE